MKNAKKVFAMLIVLALAISMAIPVSAAVGTGKISIEGAISGKTYTAYKIADLDYVADGNKFAYSIDTNTAAGAAWLAFLDSNDNAKNIFTWYASADNAKKIVFMEKDTFAGLSKAVKDAKMADFAVEAVAYAKNNDDITGTVISGETEVPYGYYAVDSTTGTICSVNSVNGTVTIKEKNNEPTIEKKILSEQELLDSLDVKIGDVITYQVKITVNNGAENFVVVDTLTDGLDLVKNAKGDAIADTENWYDYIDISNNGITIDEANATKTPKTDAVTYTMPLVGEENIQGQSFTLTYYAKVNSNAIIDSANKNEVKLKYGQDHETESKTVNVYSLSFNISKVDGSNKALSGAQFEIYKGSTKLKFDAVMNGQVVDYYLYNPNGSITSLTDVNGKYTIKGVDLGTYTIKEVVVPTGFNAPSGDFTITISDDDSIDATITPGYTGDAVNSDNKTITITNLTGAVLPSTGATGTIIFITVGGLMVVAMGVLLVVRKRMSKVVYTR